MRGSRNDIEEKQRNLEKARRKEIRRKRRLGLSYNLKDVTIRNLISDEVFEDATDISGRNRRHLLRKYRTNHAASEGEEVTFEDVLEHLQDEIEDLDY
eukprot:UN05594